jgi:hypothetical protein
MKRMKRVVALGLFLNACCASGCFAVKGPEASLDALRARSAFDLNCPQEKLTIVTLTGQCGVSSWNACTKGVSGCDRRGTYVYFGADNWVMNNALKDSPK